MTRYDGGPTHVVLALASARAGLIAMGTRGRSGLERLLLGSAADALCRWLDVIPDFRPTVRGLADQALTSMRARH